jgi:hypothetical protein
VNVAETDYAQVKSHVKLEQSLQLPCCLQRNISRSLKFSSDGAFCKSVFFFLDFIHCLGVLQNAMFRKLVLLPKKPRFGSWFYFRLQVTEEQKPNLLVPVVELVSD